MTNADDLKYMKRCLELASKGEGMTYPNPIVGSVIVHSGRIIGEGYHLRSGGPHAEVIAINSVKEKELLKSASLYVNLEPCSHFGKTPPCADLIVSYGIPRVVIGTTDTNSKVAGQGLAKLIDAGCEVVTGVAEAECRMLNRRFFAFHEKKRPYITLKWAQSADGFIDIVRKPGKKPGINWITGKAERALVHRWRASEQAILVGAKTLRTDMPQLNVRDWKGNNPVRVFLSRSGRIEDKLIENETNGMTIVFTENMEVQYSSAVKVLLTKESSSASQVAAYLYSLGIQSLFIEGGSEVLNHFIAEELWDEARIFSGQQEFKEGVRAPELHNSIYSKTIFGGSTLDICFRDIC
jgi:diaminohydroxyphosphoribosylaminopyrimidine deaminase / 5-amino-6-(5-phosphoribosylamino)uracil reductase